MKPFSRRSLALLAPTIAALAACQMLGGCTVTPPPAKPRPRTHMLMVGVDANEQHAESVALQLEELTRQAPRRLTRTVTAAAFDRALGQTIAATLIGDASAPGSAARTSGDRFLLYIAATGRVADGELVLELSGKEHVSLTKLAHQLELLAGHEAVIVLDTVFPGREDMLGPFATATPKSEGLTVWVTGSPTTVFLGVLRFPECLAAGLKGDGRSGTWEQLKQRVDAMCHDEDRQKQFFRSAICGGQGRIDRFLGMLDEP